MILLVLQGQPGEQRPGPPHHSRAEEGQLQHPLTGCYPRVRWLHRENLRKVKLKIGM